MDKKSKAILGLRQGKIIQKASKYFSESEKHFIIQEYYQLNAPKLKYGKNILVNWKNTDSCYVG